LAVCPGEAGDARQQGVVPLIEDQTINVGAADLVAQDSYCLVRPLEIFEET